LLASDGQAGGATPQAKFSLHFSFFARTVFLNPFKEKKILLSVSCSFSKSRRRLLPLRARRNSFSQFSFFRRALRGNGDGRRGTKITKSAFPIFDDEMSAFHFHFQLLSFFPFQFSDIFNGQSYGKAVAVGDFGKFSDIMIL